jgi:hypothetical protein
MGCQTERQSKIQVHAVQDAKLKYVDTQKGWAW